jgi:hypothetical protein
MDLQPKASDASTLAQIAAQINALHVSIEASLRTSLQTAAEAGRLLTSAKALVNHGEWLPWLATNFRGSARTAQTYLKLAEGATALEQRGHDLAELTLTEAARLLSKPEAAATPTPAVGIRFPYLPDLSDEDRQWLAEETDSIKAKLDEVRPLVLELVQIRDKEEWRGMGYASFKAFLEDVGLDEETFAELLLPLVEQPSQ